jgi:serine/threonine protein kinase
MPLSANQHAGPKLSGYPLPPYCPFSNPIHLAPEQLLERPRTTRQSDIYALSETAFWMLTGQHPFQTPNHESTVLLEAKGRGPCR